MKKDVLGVGIIGCGAFCGAYLSSLGPVFKNCKAFIRTLPLLQYDDQNSEDLDTEGEDHVADEVRYFCMSRPVKPAAVRPKMAGGVALLDIGQLGAAPKRLRMEIINEETNETHRHGADPAGGADPEPLPAG